MPVAGRWTEAMDARVRDLRGDGMTWDAIAAQMDLSRNVVLERGRKIGARRRPPVLACAVEARDRAPRPAGHPQTWGLLTHQTPLAGAAYPYPVFL